MIFNLFSSYDTDIAIILLACILVAVVVSLSLHEFAHAYTAHLCGDDTAKVNGRMTVNPIKHLDPFGFLLLMVVGFGFAKPVPINPYNFKKTRRDYFFVSVAGVTVNLILAFISSFFYVLIATYASATLFSSIVISFFGYLMFINLGLMLFNFIPIFPLDGFRIAESALGRNNGFTRFMRKYGQYILIGLLLWSVAVDWISGYISIEAASVLQYFDILGYALGFLVDGISSGFILLWELVF